jgi:uncharacterized protein YutE (UPF0331/DUF86 family)
MDNKDLFQTTLGIRNFEIELFWKRSNYFLVLNTTIAVGYFSKKIGYDLGVSFLGFWISCLWFAVTLGGKFWQSRWEQQLTDIERKLKLEFQLFTASPDNLKEQVRKSLNNNNHSWHRILFDNLVLYRFSVSFMMTLLSFSFIILWLALFFSNINIGGFQLIQEILKNNINETQNIYWLFSAAAQSISAFLAFLLAGFAIVLHIMTTMEEHDETLEEILHILKRKYYKIITVLSFIIGLAIILSLSSVYLNGTNNPYKSYYYIATALLDFISIMGGIIFMIYILNPDKYKNLATELYEKEKQNISKKGEEINGIIFLQKFIQLEITIRRIVEVLDHEIDKKYINRLSLSLRDMIEIIWRNEYINRELYDNLREINKIRNLVVHGKIDKVDSGLIHYIKDIENALRISLGNRSKAVQEFESKNMSD